MALVLVSEYKLVVQAMLGSVFAQKQAQQAERRPLLRRDDIFLVTDGPIEADDLLWWYIKDEGDPNIVGWAACRLPYTSALIPQSTESISWK